MSSAMARGAYNGPGSGKWEIGELVISVLSSNHTFNFSHAHHCFGAKAKGHTSLQSFLPILDTLPTCDFYFNLGPLTLPHLSGLYVSLFPQLPLALSNMGLHLISHEMCTFILTVLKHWLPSCNQIFKSRHTLLHRAHVFPAARVLLESLYTELSWRPCLSAQCYTPSLCL